MQTGALPNEQTPMDAWEAKSMHWKEQIERLHATAHLECSTEISLVPWFGTSDASWLGTGYRLERLEILCSL